MMDGKSGEKNKGKEQTGNNDEGKDTQTIDAVRERGQERKDWKHGKQTIKTRENGEEIKRKKLDKEEKNAKKRLERKLRELKGQMGQ